MKTGPQRYPGASTAAWHQGSFPGSVMESNVIGWHTTEGTSLPGYGGGATAPNLTALPDFTNRRLRWYQHFDFDVSSRALRNEAGGVQTNTLNVCQVELVGTCDPAAHARWSTPHLYTPALPEWVIRDLAAFARWAHDEHGVPLRSGLVFKPYPSSFGANGVRMSGAEWSGFAGHCGHQHVPENDHGDPGAFPIAAILAAAGGTPLEADVAVTDAEMNEIADRVLTRDGRIINPLSPPSTNTHNSLATAAFNIETVVRRIEDAVDGLTSLELTPEQVAAIAAAVTDAVAEQVADKLAARLAE